MNHIEQDRQAGQEAERDSERLSAEKLVEKRSHQDTRQLEKKASNEG